MFIKVYALPFFKDLVNNGSEIVFNNLKVIARKISVIFLLNFQGEKKNISHCSGIFIFLIEWFLFKIIKTGHCGRELEIKEGKKDPEAH